MRKEKPDGGILIGYARVSTEDQNLDMQIAALERAGVHPDHIHVEKVSGVAKRRPGRDLAVKDMREGDERLRTLPLDVIAKHVADFICYADTHRASVFDVTAIGTGLAGYTHEQIAPMFAGAPHNCNLPREWRHIT